MQNSCTFLGTPKKSFLSRFIRKLRLGYKHFFSQCISKCLGRYGFIFFGIPSGIQEHFEIAKSFSLIKENAIPKIAPKTIHDPLFWRFQTILPEIPNDGVIVAPAIATKEGANLNLDAKLVTSFIQLIDGKKAHQHDLFNFSSKRFFPKIKKINEPVISLVTPRQGAFYHWMYEILPRLQLVEDVNLPLKKIFVSCNLPFQRQSLELLGYSEESIIDASQIDAVISPHMIIPSVPCLLDHAPLWTCQFLQKKLLPCVRDFPLGKPKIYISRSKARWRRVLNEEEVLNFLEPLGFECIHLETLSFAEQISLFAHAEVIVAPHGAGLSNIAFCKAGTKLLELFSTSYVHTCYWRLCSALGIDYAYLFGEGVIYPEGFDPKEDPDFTINLDKLKKSLQL